MVIMDRYILFSDELDRHRQEHAAIIIQSIIRRFLAIRLLERMKMERRKERAAVIIQSGVRKFLAIRTAKQLRYEREILRRLQEKHAAIVIQRFYRQQRQKKYEHAAIVLQSHVRKYLAVRLLERMKAEHCGSSMSPADREQSHHNEEHAAIVIQREIRKFLAIRKVDRIRAKRDQLRQIKERHAAIVIQRFYRTHRNQRFEQAAIILQKHVRTFLAVRRYKRVKLTLKNQTPLIHEEAMEVDQMGDRLQEQIDDGQQISEEKLNAVCDRLMSETNKAAQTLDQEGPLGKHASNAQHDEYSAALTIQKIWRGYNTRRRNSDILAKLATTRLSLRNSPDGDENPSHDHPVHQLIEIYLPLFFSTSARKRQLAASFMNLATENSAELTQEFIAQGGIPAIIAASLTGSERKQDDFKLQKEISELLQKCLNSPASEHDINEHIEELLEILIRSFTSHQTNPAIMNPTCSSLLKLARHPEAPGNLKRLQFPSHVSQWRKHLVDKTASHEALAKAEETLRLINAMPE